MRTEQIPTIFRLKTIYCILPFWIVITICLASNISFPDLGHFIKSGEVMLESRAILSQDLFTHTYHGLHYINSGWLSQVSFAFCERMSGLEIFIFLKTILLIITITIIYHFIWNITKNYRISLIFIFFTIVLGITNWSVRPQIFIIPIFAFFYSHLYRTETIKSSFILLFSFLMILWVNFHSSFSLGIILVGIFLVGEAIEKYSGSRRIKDLIKDSRLKRFLFLLIILVSVTLINPYGIDIWRDMWANASISQERSTEWKPTIMKDFTGYCYIISIVISGIILKYSKRRITVTEAVLLLAFLFAGFKASRMIIWWGIVSAPILAVHFCSIDAVRERISGGKGQGAGSGSECLPLNILIIIFLVIATVSFLPWFRPYHPIEKVTTFINPETNPVEIVNYIKGEKLKGNMYNDINWGSYIIWRLWPEYKVFADNRLHLVPEEIWKDCEDVRYGLRNWEKILDKYKISFVVLSKKDNKRTIEFIKNSQGWKKVYEDNVGAVFVRRLKGDDSGLIARPTVIQGSSPAAANSTLFQRRRYASADLQHHVLNDSQARQP
ncbi:MAG: hypothetical protein U9Q89_04755 [Thermodesulfobacteriota bacterium]|nr:hypothetical protein [Thermodesulfobacteriota bacterium]